ncbi:hypothetical protein BS47DRAFT_1364321 [Hydnum rufescens UP504]|uniref:Uncharacterized protein n=1 Tax=Hydnum rufescens UP504 TaxID=1448309 RepID=A0A9P6ARV1_9AGAM|nr:hypothetical protein BS47DRAFT_1364321 [Hydnum rufescens UP504]
MIGRRLTPQLIKLQTDIKQTSCKPAAINDMQGVADVAENMPIIAINPNLLLPVLDRNVTDVPTTPESRIRRWPSWKTITSGGELNVTIKWMRRKGDEVEDECNEEV